jgi:thiol-disulfide isomerase/thioredoxin
MKSVSESQPNTGPCPPVTVTRRGMVLAALAAPLVSWAELAPGAARHALAAPTAPSAVEDFDQSTWAELLKNSPRPAAYVFTTSYCPSCPDAFARLQAFIAAARQKVELAVVVMDVQGAQALAHARHYVGASRLYAFDGFEPAIRQSVDPKWPKVTPYIVLLGRNGSVQRSIGLPEAAVLQRWLA